jgi:hypothetical protein
MPPLSAVQKTGTVGKDREARVEARVEIKASRVKNLASSSGELQNVA